MKLTVSRDAVQAYRESADCSLHTARRAVMRGVMLDAVRRARETKDIAHVCDVIETIIEDMYYDA